MLRAFLLAAFGALAVAQSLQTTLLYQFPPSPNVNLENLIVRKNGNLLLDVISRAEIYSFDVKTNKPTLLFSVPNEASVLGIAEPKPGSDKFIFAVGNSTYTTTQPFIATAPGSYAIWSLDLTGSKPVAKQIVNIREAGFLNGVSAVPGLTNYVLVADSIAGKVWTVNTDTGAYTTLSQDPLMAPVANFTLGINGIHVRGNYAYFTNTAKYLFAKLPISTDPTKGVIATAPAQLVVQAKSLNDTFDDFAFDQSGTAWVTTVFTRISTISPAGKLTLGVVNDTTIYRPTAVAFAQDYCTLYIVTTGNNTVYPPPTSGSVHSVNVCNKY